MSNKTRPATHFCILLLIAVVAVTMEFEEIQLNPTALEKVLVLLFTFVLIAAVIERAVEVYVAARYDTEKLSTQHELNYAKGKLAKAEIVLSAERERQRGSRAADRDEEYMGLLIGQVREAQQKLDEISAEMLPELLDIRIKKIRAANSLALILSALVSVVGVRLLGQLVQLDSEQAAGVFGGFWQSRAFHVTDILLTTLVLAGGADGIHKIIKFSRPS